MRRARRRDYGPGGDVSIAGFELHVFEAVPLLLPVIDRPRDSRKAVCAILQEIAEESGEIAGSERANPGASDARIIEGRAKEISLVTGLAR